MPSGRCNLGKACVAQCGVDSSEPASRITQTQGCQQIEAGAHFSKHLLPILISSLFFLLTMNAFFLCSVMQFEILARPGKINVL